jgi:glycosyltransferase involved in cell wall biosynthesis
VTGASKRLKLMFVGPYPPPYSGPELGMKQFLDSSLSREFRIRFVKTNFRTSNAEKGSISVSTALRVGIFHLRFLWTLLSFRPALMYYPITATAAGWFGRDIPCIVMSRLFGAKVVIHLRAGHFQSNFQKFPRFLRRLVRWSCSMVSIALVQAERLRGQFEGLVAQGRIRVLRQAIDTAEYDKKAGDSEERKIVLFLGNLSHSKGYCDLVRALPRVADAIGDVKFVFCGSIVESEATGVYFDQSTGTELNHESANAAHLHVQSSSYRANYDWRGVVAGEEKLALLRSCALAVLPSYSEGFSRALMEAMSVGKPVVYTPVGAHPEFIFHEINGLMVQPGDVQGIAAAIIRLLKDDVLRREMGDRNYRHVREKFDVQVISKELGSIFMRVLTGEERIICADIA